MELGNMMFGNSRGEYPIEDRSLWQKTMCEAMQKCNISGYGSYEKEDKFTTNRGGFENDVFLVNPYDWDADCDCGFDDLNYEWWENNPHTDQCFYTRINNFCDGLENRYNDEGHAALVKWCSDNCFDYELGGCLVHCDCGVNERYEEWAKNKCHTEECRYIQPNFLYKPTGFRINWYKYMLRDAYMNQDITFDEFVKILDHCVESIDK